MLDAGCGPGHWTDFLRKQGVDISGVDLVPAFIAIANSRFPDTTFRVASLHALDLADSSLSGVLAWYSLIHLAPTELPKVLNELRRVLKPQGHLLVGFFEGETAQPFDHAVTSAYYWSVEHMIGMLNEGRFEVLSVETRQDPGSRPHAAVEAIAVPR